MHNSLASCFPKFWDCFGFSKCYTKLVSEIRILKCLEWAIKLFDVYHKEKINSFSKFFWLQGCVNEIWWFLVLSWTEFTKKSFYLIWVKFGAAICALLSFTLISVHMPGTRALTKKLDFKSHLRRDVSKHVVVDSVIAIIGYNINKLILECWEKWWENELLQGALHQQWYINHVIS